MNQPLFIFLFDSHASKHLTLTQKTQLAFLRWDFSAYCNNRQSFFWMLGHSEGKFKTVQIRHVNIHQCGSLKYLSSWKSELVKGGKNPHNNICSLIPWYSLQTSTGIEDMTTGIMKKDLKMWCDSSYCLLLVFCSPSHYLYVALQHNLCKPGYRKEMYLF